LCYFGHQPGIFNQSLKVLRLKRFANHCPTGLALQLISTQIYIGDMSVNPEDQAIGTPVFIEVPKPVNLMTQSEKDEFIEEILEALEGK
jgi:hypothetical protein